MLSMMMMGISFFTWTLIRLVRTPYRRTRTTRLNGPSSRNLLLGFPEFFTSHDSSEIYERWAEEYGAVYQVPSVLGATRIVLYDPKAIAHFYAKETTTYILTSLGRFLTSMVVRCLLWRIILVPDCSSGRQRQFADDPWRCAQTVCVSVHGLGSNS